MLINRTRHFFTSDPHLGDDGMVDISGRPWSSGAESDEVFAQRWDAVVRPRDLVWVLGDLTSDVGPDPLIGRLNGTKYLIAGNHDLCAQSWLPDDGHRAEVIAAYIESGFTGVVDGAAIARSGLPVKTLLGPGLTVSMSHYPYDAAPWEEGEPDAFAPWRPKRPSRRRGPEPWLLHGHVHAAWKRRGRQVNVGVDVWGHQPVSAEELVALIETCGE